MPLFLVYGMCSFHLRSKVIIMPKYWYLSTTERVWLSMEYGKLRGCRLRVIDMAAVLFLLTLICQVEHQACIFAKEEFKRTVSPLTTIWLVVWREMTPEFFRRRKKKIFHGYFVVKFLSFFNAFLKAFAHCRKFFTISYWWRLYMLFS